MEKNQILILLDCSEQQSEEQIKKCMENFYQFVINILHSNVSVGVGNEVDFISLKKSYIQAKKAIKAKKHSIIFYNDLLLDIIMTDIQDPSKNSFMNRVLKPIINDKALLETLKIYLQNNLNLKATADHLHIHMYTLHYRLKKIQVLTCLDPKNTESIVAFYLSLYFLDEFTNFKD